MPIAATGSFRSSGRPQRGHWRRAADAVTTRVTRAGQVVGAFIHDRGDNFLAWLGGHLPRTPLAPTGGEEIARPSEAMAAAAAAAVHYLRRIGDKTQAATAIDEEQIWHQPKPRFRETATPRREVLEEIRT